MKKTVVLDVQESFRGKETLFFDGNKVTYSGKTYVVDAVPELKSGKQIYLRLYTPNNRRNGSFSLTGTIASVN